MATKVAVEERDEYGHTPLEQQLMLMPNDGKYEIVHGQIVKAGVSPGRPHGAAAARLVTRLMLWSALRDAGEVLVECAFRLPGSDEEETRVPDVSFTAKGRVAPGKRGIDDAVPDLAVEIPSPSETRASVQKKVDEYMEAGVRLIWTINPERRVATTYRRMPDGTVYTRKLRANEYLDGEDVLPGFRVKVAELLA